MITFDFQNVFILKLHLILPINMPHSAIKILLRWSVFIERNQRLILLNESVHTSQGVGVTWGGTK